MVCWTNPLEGSKPAGPGCHVGRIHILKNTGSPGRHIGRHLINSITPWQVEFSPIINSITLCGRPWQVEFYREETRVEVHRFFYKGFLHDTRTCSVATAPSITSHPSDDIYKAWIGRAKQRWRTRAVSRWPGRGSRQN